MRIDTLCLLFGQGHHRSIQLLALQLFLQKFLRGRCMRNGRLFNAVVAVQGVVGLITVHLPFMGRIRPMISCNNGQYVLRYLHEHIFFINIGIQISKIDFLHCVPPFRFKRYKRMNRIAEASGSLACRQSYYLFCNGVQVLKHTTAVQETEM